MTPYLLPSTKKDVDGRDEPGHDDVDRVAPDQRYFFTGGSAKLETRPRDGRYAEFRIQDPVGSQIDLSEAGWKTA